MRARPVLAVHREVLALAWPLTIGMLSYTAMTVADSIFVGRLGTAPLAGVGLAASCVHLLVALPHGLLAGARVHVARATGAGDPSRAGRFAWQAVWIAAAAGALGLLLAPFGTLALGLLGGDGELVIHGGGYLSWRLASLPALYLVFALGAWYNGRGDARTPTAAAVLANAANIVLDPLLIFGGLGLPALGAAGAGAATAIACALQASVLAAAAWGSLRPHAVGPDVRALRDIVRIGLPLGTHALLDVASYALFGAMLASVGEAQLAAHVIAVRVLMVSFLPGMAVAEAATVLVGQRLGAGRPAAARRIWRASTLQAVGFMAALGVVFLTFPDPLVAAFGAAPDVAAIARQVLLLAALIQVFDAVAMVAVGTLTGAGDTRFTMAIGLGGAWLVKVPVAAVAVLALDLGAWGAWLGIAAELVVVAALCVVRVERARWGMARSVRGAMAAATR